MNTASVEDFKHPHLDEVALQAQLNAAEPGSTVTLWPAKREIQGPIFIHKPIVLDGQGAAIWRHHGPVLVIRSENVQLCNLRVEVTGEYVASAPEMDHCAIAVEKSQSVNFDNVRVRGNTIGLPKDEGRWLYPQEVIHFGRIACDHRYEYELQIVAPAPGWIISRIDGIAVSPWQLIKGLNVIKITIDSPVFSDTLLLGELLFAAADSSIIRWIGLNAYVSAEVQAETTAPNILWQPSEEDLWALAIQNQPPSPSSAQPRKDVTTEGPTTKSPTAKRSHPQPNQTPPKQAPAQPPPWQQQPFTVTNQTPKGNVWNTLHSSSTTSNPTIPSQSADPASTSPLPSIFTSPAQPTQMASESPHPPVQDPLSLAQAFNGCPSIPSNDTSLSPNDESSDSGSNEQASTQAADSASAPVPDIFT